MQKNLSLRSQFPIYIQYLAALIPVIGLTLCCFAYVALGDDPVVPAGSDVAQVASSGTGSTTGAAPPQPGFGSMLMPFALMFGVIYFLMIRPQQKKMKVHDEMIKALSHGDEVVTQSGMLGKVTGIADKVVTLEIAANVRVKMLKSQVSQVLKGQASELA